jgi:hypothetical protein
MFKVGDKVKVIKKKSLEQLKDARLKKNGVLPINIFG